MANTTKSMTSVLCDRTMVEQVLLNLARNAMQAMDSPKILERSLLIGVRRANANGTSKKWVEFSVADLGGGIGPEVQQQLFKQFFTVRTMNHGSAPRTYLRETEGPLPFTAISYYRRHEHVR